MAENEACSSAGSCSRESCEGCPGNMADTLKGFDMCPQAA